MYDDTIKAELGYIFGGLSPYEEMELDDIYNKIVISADYDAQGELNLLINAEV